MRHNCPGEDRCGYCRARIDAIEDDRSTYSTRDLDYMADAAAAQDFYGRGGDQ